MRTDEKCVLRELAEQVAEIAVQPEMERRRQDWYRHNALEPGKPLVFASPEGSWTELLPRENMQCEDPLAQDWEWNLRFRLYVWEHFADDEVIDDVFEVRDVCTNTGWGLEPEYHRSGTERGSYVWEPPLKGPSDLEKLHFPETIVDEEASAEQLELAHELFDGLLQVERHNWHWWTLGIIGELALLRGMAQTMMDMALEPQFVHEAMAFLLEGKLRWLDSLEERGLLSPNFGNHCVGSGGFGFTEELPAAGYDPAHVRCRDMWGFCEAQEAVNISPEMFREFVLNYQLPILERFGLNCYGCCEPVHDWFEHVLIIPHLRRISISPWCDREISAEVLQDKYIYSWKPNPARLAAINFDEDLVRREIRETLEIAQGCCVEITMKDTHTVNNQPERFDRWAAIAQEEACRSVE